MLAEKLKALSFRGALRAEESLIFRVQTKEIPRFARNDSNRHFFRILFSRLGVIA
jgi:hypothetical protein